MSLRERLAGAVAALRGWPTGPAKASRNMPDWPAHWLDFAYNLAADFENPTRAFLNTPAVNESVRRVLRDVGQADVKVWKGRGKGKVEVERVGKLVDEGGNLADLLHYANPSYTGRQLRQSLVGSRILAGDAYMHCQTFGAKNSPPSELWSYAGHLTRPVPGKGRTIKGYEYQAGGQGEWIPIEGGVVIQFSGYNPNDEPVGLSDLKAVENVYLAEFYALQWIRDFYKRGAVLPGIWSWQEGRAPRAPSGSADPDEAVKAIQATIMRRFGAESGSRWLPVIVDGLEYVAAGMKLSEMELDKQLALIEQKIHKALGIPIERESEKADPMAAANYWLGPIKDHLDLLADVMTERLAPMFGPDFEIAFSLDKVLAIQNAKLDQAKVHYLLGGEQAVETPNEVRGFLDLPEMDGEEHDELYRAPEPVDPLLDPMGDKGKPSEGNDGDKPRPTPRVEKSREIRLADKRQKGAAGLDRYQRRLQAIVVERLAEQRRSSIAAVKAWAERFAPDLASENGRRKARLDALDVGDLFGEPDPEDEARIRRALARLIAERGEDALKDLDALAGVALEVEFDSQRAAIERFMETQIDRAINLPDGTTREMLHANLQKAIEKGGTLSDLVGAVHDTFDARRNQALTIARTESLSAYNFASVEAWAQSGVVDSHEWLTSRSGLGGRHSEDPDGRYHDLDGQVRAIGEPFNVGAVSMLYPGDPSAPPGETCNCVCTTSPVVNEALLSQRIEAIRLRDALSRNRRDGEGVAATNRIASLFGYRGAQ